MRSIRGRLLAFSAFWTALALLLAWLFISSLLRDFVEGRFGAEMQSVADTVMAQSEWRGGKLFVTPPDDTRFNTPLSGWYWQVAEGGQVLAKSRSLWTSDLGRGTSDGPLMNEILFRRHNTFTAPGDGSSLQVTVAIPRVLLQSEEERITRPLALALVVLGAVLVLASILTVTIGLGALDRMRRGLEAVREGRAARLAVPDTRELRPFVQDLNHLIAENQAVIVRARTHVGNLAHALKTPLAALMNTGAEPELTARMDRIIRWHLKRARTAAQNRSLGQVTFIAPVVDDLLAVLAREIETRDLTVTCDIPQIAFAGEREDLEEMLGNILDNAVKWADRSIHVTATANGGMLAIMVGDDGPGIPADAMSAALQRGVRLDETVNGSGLGLAIVDELTRLYDGAMELSDAEPGLRVVLRLPAAGKW